ncbi:MFS transporter [Dyadobacter subterraneus]|uniref:MFS transporter n=1 Tax=Dyadobacter subterraneus TaxID=2773304 RepID=A0ABR9WDW9_9BACT|nr:MFS transporter [Dyadobacter subterraneus]MBE9463608.1 MFS transporter [Dyadobacter subterraneus]
MKMKPAEFIALSACTMTLTALGIDIMLPALGAIRQDFGLDPQSTVTSKIISFFFMGQVAQIFFGILSDRFGRIAILRVGFPLYIIGGITAALAPDFPLMLTARFVAGVGASAVFMTTVAGVRDRFVGDQMARIMSLIFTIFLFTPIIAPFLGLAILSVWSWKMVFLTPPLFAIMVFVWSLRLEESHPAEKRSTFHWNQIFSEFRNVLTNRIFLKYTGITTALFTALSSYVASSEHIVGDIYGKPKWFAWIFAGIGSIMSLCSLLNSYLSARYGASQTVKGLLILYTAVSGLLLVLTLNWGDPPDIFIFFISVGILMGINVAIEPNSSALALEPFGNFAGLASAMYGTFFFFTGGFLGSVISSLMAKEVFPIVLSLFLIGLTSLLLVLRNRSPQI